MNLARSLSSPLLLPTLFLLAAPAIAQNVHWDYRDHSATVGKAMAVVPGDRVAWAATHATGNTNSGDIQVQMLDSSSTVLWTYLFDSGGVYDGVTSMTADPSGNLYVGGFTMDQQTTAGSYLIFSLSPTGILRWTYQWPSVVGWGYVSDLLFAPDGNLYSCGYNQIHSSFYSNMAIASHKADGTERWKRVYENPRHPHASGWGERLAYDPVLQNLYAVGSFGEPAGVGVMAVDLLGNSLWHYQYHGSQQASRFSTPYDWATDVVVGTDHNVYLSADVQDSSSDVNFTVISLGPTGLQRWIYSYNGARNFHDFANAIVWGPDGNVYAAGRTIEADGDTMAIVGLTPGGLQRWISLIPPPYNYDGTYDLAADVDGNLYSVGWSQDLVGGLPTAQFFLRSLRPNGQHRWDWIAPGGGGLAEFVEVDDVNSTVYMVGQSTDQGGEATALVSIDIGDLILTQTPLHLGQSAVFTVDGALPGERVDYVMSSSGLGVGAAIPQLGLLHLGIVSPFRRLGNAIADAAGHATFSVTVPPTAALIDVSTQAVAMRGAGGADSVKSNPLLAPILP